MPEFADCHIGLRITDSSTGLTNVLEEFGAQVVGNIITSWVASESGKEFEIMFRAENYPCSLQLVIFVDGIELVNRGYDQRKMGREIICQGVSIDADTVKPFVFSDIVFPEEDTVFDHTGMDDVGTIRIELLQVVFTESRHPKYHVPSLSNDPLQKHSCIAGARGVRLGEQRRYRTKKMTSMPFDPENPGPVAVFKYVYRPRAMLISQGIIPTYVPRFVEHLESPTPSMRPRDEGREDAMRRLKEEQERIQREMMELEELRRLRERHTAIQRELDELESFGFGPDPVPDS
ncbi:uncharacterized protein FOMMEDRAFT_22382 [Fomitiporia mediterranea MF3/22]|uniref:uncharacterized protein n=1 Tax=Fomitiporia mediterranea (strain MF3/22) TaxID=694068 RepID=UPI0004408C0B|nr:uncharacterized protein FOMMEDRAFT_22382 [Fomitiporia mediterranea MF3/22]EJD00630.1 hypothetical protein FOMMEDRAFT_22382 [Fomitiporia mediterranea MF3/22]